VPASPSPLGHLQPNYAPPASPAVPSSHYTQYPTPSRSTLMPYTPYPYSSSSSLLATSPWPSNYGPPSTPLLASSSYRPSFNYSTHSHYSGPQYYRNSPYPSSPNPLYLPNPNSSGVPANLVNNPYASLYSARQSVRASDTPEPHQHSHKFPDMDTSPPS
jgi:hypothetical protein